MEPVPELATVDSVAFAESMLGGSTSLLGWMNGEVSVALRLERYPTTRSTNVLPMSLAIPDNKLHH